jgi:DNA-binding CsgD family transcriptional regulator
VSTRRSAVPTEKGTSGESRRALDLWNEGRVREAEDVLSAVRRDRLSDDALLLQARLTTFRDPAAGLALTASLPSRHSPRFSAEAAIIEASGLSRIGEFAEAEARLGAAEAHAGNERDLRAKVALYRSAALMLQGRVPEIEPLLRLIRDTSDPNISAQSGTMQAVLLRQRGHYRQQIPVLLRSLFELRSVDKPNAWVLASTLHMLAEIVVEFWEPTLAAIVEEEFDRIAWHDGIADWHFFISRALSWWYALSGDSLGAFRYLKRAVGFPVRDALRVLNHADRAYLARTQGEHAWSDQELAEAGEIARGVAWRTESDERDDASIALASLAELYAVTDVERANEYLARFQSFRHQMSLSNTRRHDRTDEAFVGGVKGVVAAALGRLGEATRALGDAYRIYDQIGYDWRAGRVALHLASITSDPAHLESARAKLRHYPNSWLATEYAQAAERVGLTDVLPGTHLTAAQWRVFKLLADGYSLGEIASHLGRSVNTVRNHVGAIYAALGVHSRTELRALARKAGAPTIA